MNKVKSYLSLIKFSHTIFAMPFALIGLFIGFNRRQDFEFNLDIFENQYQDFNSRGVFKSSRWLYNIFYMNEAILISFLVILCMVFARSAAMAFNRYLDRSFDAKNPRTAIREIPAGIIKANNALLFTIVSSLLFVVCSFFINKLCFFLSPVAYYF